MPRCAFAVQRLGSADVFYKLGLALRQTGHPDDAMAQFGTVLRMNSKDAQAHNDLGLAIRRKVPLGCRRVDYCLTALFAGVSCARITLACWDARSGLPFCCHARISR